MEGQFYRWMVLNLDDEEYTMIFMIFEQQRVAAEQRQPPQRVQAHVTLPMMAAFPRVTPEPEPEPMTLCGCLGSMIKGAIIFMLVCSIPYLVNRLLQ